MQITEDRKKRVIHLYFNQHKTYAEIAQIEKMSPRDIHAIIKEEIARRQKHKDQELSAEANKLFSQGKTTVQVATMLNLPASKVIKLHIDYWKLRRLDKLNIIYKETNGKIWQFLKLYTELIKKRHMSIEKVANVVEIAIDKLPYMESLYGQVKEQVDKMQYKIQLSEKHLHSVNDEIASSKELLKSYTNLCERKRQEAENLNNDISRLETLISRFKNNDEEYYKLKKTVEEEVSKFLADGKVILQFALVSVIESIRRNPGKYNNLLVCNSSSSSTSIISAQQSSSQPEHYDEEYNTMILEVADKLYSSLLKQLVSTIMDNTVSK